MGFITLNNYSISGDCNNTSSGGIYFEVTGFTVGTVFTVQEFPTPTILPTSGLTTSPYVYSFEGIPPGNYTLQIQDNTSPPSGPIQQLLSFHISSGSTVSAESEDTTCGETNGRITGYTQNSFGVTSFYLYDTSDNLINSVSPSPPDTNYVFTNLTPGDYYVIADDGGGCTGQSESVIIRPSTSFDFGYYTVNDANCVPNEGSGKIFITGLTTPIDDYTINWISNVNGQTGTTVTGLTQGLYTVEITNQIGCVTTKSIFVDKVEPIGIANGSLFTTAPTCFASDGSITVIVTGGTAPFYYSCSNGDSIISFSPTVTFTGLSSDLYTIIVTDAGLCTTNTQTTLSTPGSFGTVSVSTTESVCNANNGSVIVTINNGSGSGTFTYTLSGNTGNSPIVLTSNQTGAFNNVGSGDYVLLVSDGLGCIFTGTTSVKNEDKFTISTTITKTTCGLNNGTITVNTTSGATLPLSYNLFGPKEDSFPQNVTQLNGVFTNLKSGTYELTVKDNDGCSQIENLLISPSSGVECSVIKSDPQFGADGTINLIMTAGDPPFIYEWSPNVGSQSGTTITGLTSDMYSVLITDSSGCQKLLTLPLAGTNLVQDYDFVTICEKSFENTDVMGIRGIQQMYNEGYFDLISGDTNCILNNADFKILVEVGGETAEEVFYTSTSLNDYPTTFLWSETVKEIIESFVGIGEVIVDLTNNTIRITNDCEELNKNCTTETYNLLNDTRIVLNLVITYNISCEICN
jgi:hypothetical protein